MHTRAEHDSMGLIEVPEARLWGAQTQRALAHFGESMERMPDEVIRALATVKAACARVNADLGLLPADKAQAIQTAADEVARGACAIEFPLSVWQTGSGTQSHMNMNEVLANRASELMGSPRGNDRCVHPNDDVNLGQSTNDVFPTALHLAVALGITHRLLPAVNGLRDALLEKSTRFRDVIKVGRTHLQDAAPLTLGQEMSGYACQLEAARAFIEAAMPAICQLAIGGSAVGTGLNAHPEFGTRVAQRLAEQTGLPFQSAPNKFAVMAAHDALVNVHGALRTLAVALTKIANDLRWLASGPRAGLGEISLPSNEPGSSMMPGKTNPTQCESLLMISCQVMANDVAMSLAGSAGNFQLNAHKPLMALALTQSIRVLTQGMLNFNRYCVAGIEANRERIAQHLSQSLMLATALSPHLGYDRVGELVSRAHNANTTLREEAVASGWLSPEQFDLWVDPTRMV